MRKAPNTKQRSNKKKELRGKQRIFSGTEIPQKLNTKPKAIASEKEDNACRKERKSTLKKEHRTKML